MTTIPYTQQEQDKTVLDVDPQMMFTEPAGSWHWWFAWHPIKTYDQRPAWFRWVRRRCMQKHQYLTGGPDFSWQYAIPQAVSCATLS